MKLKAFLSISGLLSALVASGCVVEETAANDDDGTSASSGSAGEGGTAPIDPNQNTDGDCMTDLEEIELGTDPNAVDTDGDGVSDCDEIACVSDPVDINEKCYACGWKHDDPHTIMPNGAAIGSVMNDINLTDQCGDEVSVWDFHGQYFILYMTAAW